MGKTKPKTNKKKGRPSLWDKIDKDKLIELYADGKTDQQVAEIFGVTTQTLGNWRKKDPEFFVAISELWKKAADHKVERSLYERACGYSHPETKAQWVQDEKGGRWEYAELTKHYPPDATSIIFWLKNRQPRVWRDKHDIEHNIDPDLLKKLLDSFPDGFKDKVMAELLKKE